MNKYAPAEKTKLSITIPDTVLARFDLLAKECDRARHWLMVKALERGLELMEEESRRVVR